MDPKYFYRKAKPRNVEQDPWEKIELNRKNWWYVQLNGSILTAFDRYHIPEPAQVYVEDSIEWTGKTPETTISIVRRPITTPDEFDKWKENELYIKSELDIQARANSEEGRIIFHFELI